MPETTIAYQCDDAGLFLCETVSHESPEEPGVFNLPRGCTFTAPPTEVPDGRWPRWTGTGWDLVNIVPPAAPTEPSPVDKLRDFLAANPDVAALLSTNQGQPSNV